MDNNRKVKVAIVHYWLNGMRGGEKVLESFCSLYPDADIYTHVYDSEKISDKIKKHRIYTSFISKLPFSKKKYQAYLPFMPLALEQLDLTEYDLVISSESGPAKGVVTRPEALHICYCHSPMRYVWDMYYQYMDEAGLLKKIVVSPLIHYLKIWDFVSAARVDSFIANSSYVAKRIEKIYRRSSTVINPPVDVESFYVSEEQGDYYLMLGQLVSYKKPELAVKAFMKSGKKLVVVGEGECKKNIIKMAEGYDNIEILGRQPFDKISELYSKCKALIFPGVEDFGIVPLEAMASGRPVIAYGAGGVLDSVRNKKTGLFFYEQTIESINAAVDDYETEKYKFDPVEIRKHAELFSIINFEKSIRNFIHKKMEKAF
nr:glycosyltransferase [uncultured Amphritea sp.]